jgi:SAM-dependent methyltransferase
VRECVVLAGTSGPDDVDPHSFTVFVALDADSGPPAVESASATSLVREWSQTWDRMVYERAIRSKAPDREFAGWRNSCTGQPLRKEELEEQADAIVGRILSHRPQRVLEIGVGTGLLLHRLAPHVRRFVGMDFSPHVVEMLRQDVRRAGYSGTSVVQAAAHQLRDLPPETFDAVVLNSVVQYFPSVSYLIEVLRQASRRVESGGHIHIGDVRSLPLLEAFHASVQLHKADAALTSRELLSRVRNEVARERELVLHPTFFRRLRPLLPGLGSVTDQLKRGRSLNELTRFRYDVTLGVGSEPARLANWRTLHWRDIGSLEMLQRSLGRLSSTTVVRGIPNLRVGDALRAAELLKSTALTADELRRLLATAQQGVNPEDLWLMGEAAGLKTEVRWPLDGAAVDTCDAVFRLPGEEGAVEDMPEDWATDPGEARLLRNTARQLQARLREELQGEVELVEFRLLPP